jgi:hypothetical protein
MTVGVSGSGSASSGGLAIGGGVFGSVTAQSYDGEARPTASAYLAVGEFLSQPSTIWGRTLSARAISLSVRPCA